MVRLRSWVLAAGVTFVIGCGSSSASPAGSETTGPHASKDGTEAVYVASPDTRSEIGVVGWSVSKVVTDGVIEGRDGSGAVVARFEHRANGDAHVYALSYRDETFALKMIVEPRAGDDVDVRTAENGFAADAHAQRALALLAADMEAAREVETSTPSSGLTSTRFASLGSTLAPRDFVTNADGDLVDTSRCVALEGNGSHPACPSLDSGEATAAYSPCAKTITDANSLHAQASAKCELYARTKSLSDYLVCATLAVAAKKKADERNECTAKPENAAMCCELVPCQGGACD